MNPLVMTLRKNTITQSLYVYSDMVIFGGINSHTKPHAHHALEIILSKELPLTVIHKDQRYTGRGIILRPDITHETLGQGSAVFLYLDPESTFGRQFAILLKEENVISFGDEIALSMITFLGNGMREDHSEAEVKKYLLDTFFTHDAFYSFNPAIDERVSSVISCIHLNFGKISPMKELTDVACLSESRLFHLFKREIGIPIRKYVLWCRIRHAIKLVVDGNNLTQSAKLSGFADVAHLNRTFVSFFGMSPSHVLKRTF